MAITLNVTHALACPAEALCDVRLPRSDGTCTRCPMEVRMASGVSSQGRDEAPEPWSACVRVRRTHDRLGNMLPGMPTETVVQVRGSFAFDGKLLGCITVRLWPVL